MPFEIAHATEILKRNKRMRPSEIYKDDDTLIGGETYAELEF